MKKSPLKVQPARKIYHPKYPSFQDKNPLLFPETRPYPFSMKFMNWVSTGGLASIMLLGNSNVIGQTTPDSLYNPFPLENAHVPYRPVSFGTGMPQRLKSEEAVQVILKAFAESGIALEENVWLDDEVGVHLNGYSRKDKIGFVFMDYQNMDNSFTLQNDKRFKKSDLMKKANLKKNLKRYREQTHRTFLEFIKDKDKYVKRITRYSTNDRKAKLVEQLSSLPSTLDSEVLFNTYYLENNINSYRNDNEHFSPFKKEIVSHLDNRFEDTEEKLLLLHLLNAYFLNKNLTAEFQTKIEEEFQKLTTIKSNKKFIEDFLTLHWFLNYTGGQGNLNQNHDYQAAKLDIMNNFPLRKWKGQLNTLYAIEDKIFLSLEEANQIDKNNKKGKQFIAPISARDNRMIISGNYTFGSEELKEESIALNKAYNLKNGMTDEIFALRREELKQLREEFSYSKLKYLPQKEKEKLQKKRDEKNKSINDKYKAMEQLTEEERAAFKLKFDDLSRRQREWRNKNAEENKMKVLRQLEAEVKIYIKWAKSQMGG